MIMHKMFTTHILLSKLAQLISRQHASALSFCCEPQSFQVNYLIDEAQDVGKGADTTISLLHHFFATHSLHEEEWGRTKIMLTYTISGTAAAAKKWRGLINIHES